MGEKNLELKSDVVELLPCVPHPQNKVHRPLVLRDARLGLRQRDLDININCTTTDFQQTEQSSIKKKQN